jgi:hypothetical protein
MGKYSIPAGRLQAILPSCLILSQQFGQATFSPDNRADSINTKAVEE